MWFGVSQSGDQQSIQRLHLTSPELTDKLSEGLSATQRSVSSLTRVPLVPMSTADLNYRALPISERIELVEDIWDSIAEETFSPFSISAEQQAELHRRYAAHLANPSSSIPWEQVRAALFKGQS